MRVLLMVLAATLLAQCAGNQRFVADNADRALVIVGVAEATGATESAYEMLWRRFDPASGSFVSLDGDDAFEAETNANDSLRIDGIPGEFFAIEVRPGAYALDSVFGRLRDGRVDYIAQGLVAGPSRPSFDVAAGETVYLGIWQLSLVNSAAVARLWRLDEEDLIAVRDAAGATETNVALRETHMRDVTCAPRRLSAYSARQIC